ncbi:MAG TPA: copper resistance CopC family protein [Methylomirabilota bacterium]|jgi:hypothetical protein
MSSRAAGGLVIAAIMGACLAHPPRTTAHAIILESSPRDEESLSSPKRLVLRFNGRIEKGLCSVQLVGPHRHTIALLRQETESPDTIAYPLPPLKPGSYQVRWKVLATDGHVTEGVVRFTVTTPEPPMPR